MAKKTDGEESRTEPGGKTVIQSVDRALFLLELLADAGGVSTLRSLSEASGLNTSTCHHLLATLARRDYVVLAEGPRGAYALGPRLQAIASVYRSQDDLMRRAGPWVDRVNVETGETVHFAIMQGFDLVTVIKRDARHAIRVDSGVLGKSDAAHATATGKALLAWMDLDSVKHLLAAKGMKAFTGKTTTDPETLLRELEEIRANGFSTDNEEFQPDVFCIGAAILGPKDEPVAAISASTPVIRATEQHLALMRREIMAAAEALSTRLKISVRQTA